MQHSEHPTYQIDEIPDNQTHKILNRAVLISGKSGTGKSSAANMLAAEYHAENRKVGAQYRAEGLVDDQTGYVSASTVVDIRIDHEQMEIIRNSANNPNIILEGRLAGIWASEERDRLEKIGDDPMLLPVTTVLFTAPRKTRWHRLRDRYSREYPDKKFSLGEIEKNEIEREQKNLERWWSLYPRLEGIEPFQPELRYPDTHLVYDLVVPAGELTVPEVVLFIDNFLTSNGYVTQNDEFLPRPEESTCRIGL